MFKWAQQQLAHVAGTQEPIYGPSAIRSVAEEARVVPYTELEREDLKWQAMDSTCVETQSFYLMADNGHVGLAQVIYSNVVGIRTTCQFNAKVFYPDRSKPPLWCSTQLRNHEFSDEKTAFYADDCALELSEDGTTYTIRSMNDDRAIVNLTIRRCAPGFQAGKTGKTLFGTNLGDPWGSIRHAFWPRCVSEGTIAATDGPVDFKGKAFFVHALQGMKPHHAAAKWNFVDFQGPTHSATMMQYVTPPSYGSTIVSVGAIARDGEIVVAGVGARATHVETKNDTDNGWPEPTKVKFTWNSAANDNKLVEASIEGDLEPRVDRVDVMAEVPGFVKKIVAGAAGTRPYIYQYMPQKKMTLKLKVGEQETIEEGTLFSEATFISE